MEKYLVIMNSKLPQKTHFLTFVSFSNYNATFLAPLPPLNSRPVLTTFQLTRKHIML